MYDLSCRWFDECLPAYQCLLAASGDVLPAKTGPSSLCRDSLAFGQDPVPQGGRSAFNTNIVSIIMWKPTQPCVNWLCISSHWQVWCKTWLSYFTIPALISLAHKTFIKHKIKLLEVNDHLKLTNYIFEHLAFTFPTHWTGCSAVLQPVFDPLLSPRNLVITAKKGAWRSFHVSLL